MQAEYDVIIMGGGPAGATLGAILGRHTQLKVGLFEKDFFPREHIGESLVAQLIPILSYSGALPKVLQSECYSAPKPGGIFAWDPEHEDPWCFTFNNDVYDSLGVLTFAIHVNRSEFDKILLDHARDMGVDVHEGATVTGVQRIGEKTQVEFEDGSHAFCKIFVEASGRITSITGTRKQFLSDYKNIAIWNHFVGGKMAQDLPGDWNDFRNKQSHIPGVRGDDWAPIGNFACDDGWFWYIPVPKMVMGKRVHTHSVGLVTDPTILATSPERRYTDMQVFLNKVKQVPLLRDLMAEAQPISDKVLTATNYSMLSDRICNYDEKWLMLGDSALFVDPLFSTGVGLSMVGAASASFLIDATLNPSISEQQKRDLWYDYQQRMRTTAITLSICIDQWYHGIARKNPESIYWKSRRGEIPAVDLRDKTFFFVGNTETTSMTEYEYTGDRNRWIETLMQMSSQSRLHFMKPFWTTHSTTDAPLSMKNPLDGLKASDAYSDRLMLRAPTGNEFAPETRIAINPSVAIRSSLLLGQMQARRVTSPEFWQDPLSHEDMLADVPHFLDCQRFYFSDRPDEVEVPFLEDQERGIALHALLKGDGQTYSKLKDLVSVEQRSLIGRLHNAGMLTFG